MTTTINYSSTLNNPKEAVLKVLLDYKNYDRWWPKKFRIFHTLDNNINHLTFYPIIGLKIIWKINKLEKHIQTTYEKGPVRGNGKWIIEEISESKTKLHYNIEVAPTNLFFKILFIKPLFKKIHITHMKKLFKNLDLYVSQSLN